MMNYRMTIECHNKSCILSVTGIRYDIMYLTGRPGEIYRRRMDHRQTGFNRNRLNRMNGKFRTALPLIMYMILFNGASTALGVAIIPHLLRLL